ncbi:hypothetical protein JB92DRAFT_2882956 [Gautieria morchelliformis]|nr:hypothetical protein JB92DRAFT_2882956 [Gautieria morchelliformis]
MCPYTQAILHTAACSAPVTWWGCKHLSSQPCRHIRRQRCSDSCPCNPRSDNNTFVCIVQQNFRNLSLGGFSMELDTGNTLLAWEGSDTAWSDRTYTAEPGFKYFVQPSTKCIWRSSPTAQHLPLITGLFLL